MLAFVGLMIVLDIVRWYISPVYAFTAEELTKAVDDKEVSDALLARWKQHPTTNRWLLLYPLAVPLTFSLYVFVQRDNPEALLAISETVEPLLTVFNGETLRDDLRHIGDNAPFGNVVVASNLFWALGAFAIVYLSAVRGGIFPTTADQAFQFHDLNESATIEFLEKGKKNRNPLFLSFFLILTLLMESSIISNAQNEVNVLNSLSYYLLLLFIGLFSMIGIHNFHSYLVSINKFTDFWEK